MTYERDDEETGLFAWPGKCEPRNVDKDPFSISHSIFGHGIFTDRDHVRHVTSFLTAGIPQQEHLEIDWDFASGTIMMLARNSAGAHLARDFYKSRSGWEVEHVQFDLPSRYRQAGHAKRMLRASVEAYGALGIGRIKLVAGGADGGYIWARAGFVADDEPSVKMDLLRQAQTLPSAASQAIRDAVMACADGDLLFDVARVSVAGAPHLGRDFLRGSGWSGHIDLTAAVYRNRLARYLG